MFIALQVIDLDTGEVLGYLGPRQRFYKHLTVSGALYGSSKANLHRLMTTSTEFALNIDDQDNFIWKYLRSDINTKEHPFIQLRLVEYKLEEVSNNMLVQVLLKDEK